MFEKMLVNLIKTKYSANLIHDFLNYFIMLGLIKKLNIFRSAIYFLQ
jgi:hypothetical protein